MSPVGEAGKEAIKTDAGRKSCAISAQKPCSISFVWISPPLPSSHPFDFFPCECALEALSLVQPGSNVCLPVEMAAVCSIVVIN